jgi:hypothetical protein
VEPRFSSAKNKWSCQLVVAGHRSVLHNYSNISLPLMLIESKKCVAGVDHGKIVRRRQFVTKQTLLIDCRAPGPYSCTLRWKLTLCNATNSEFC